MWCADEFGLFRVCFVLYVLRCVCLLLCCGFCGCGWLGVFDLLGGRFVWGIACVGWHVGGGWVCFWLCLVDLFVCLVVVLGAYGLAVALWFGNCFCVFAGSFASVEFVLLGGFAGVCTVFSLAAVWCLWLTIWLLILLVAPKCFAVLVFCVVVGCYVVTLFVLVLSAVGWCVGVVIFVVCCVLLVLLVVFSVWFCVCFGNLD